MEHSERQYRSLNYTPYGSTSNSLRSAEDGQTSTLPTSPEVEKPCYNRRLTADNFTGITNVYNTPPITRSKIPTSATMNNIGRDAADNLLILRLWPVTLTISRPSEFCA